MKYLLLLTMLSGAMPLLMAQSTPDILARHRWQHRVVLVFHPEAAPARAQAQAALPDEDPAGWRARHLFLLSLPGDARDPQVRRLYQQFDIAPDTFTVLLIGKDGGEKARRTGAILSREDLYALIDAMPMRQAEMRRAGSDRGRP